MHISLQIIIAALSVIGFYFSLKTIASLIFTSRQVAAAVIIEEKIQLYDLDMLLQDASGALFPTRGRRIAVIVPPNVWNGCEESEKALFCEMADCFGAKIYVSRAYNQ